MEEKKKEKTFKEKIKAVNKFLKDNEKNKNYTHDHKGYSGYKPQWMIDAVNTEFVGEWSLEILSKETLAKDPNDPRSKETALVHVKFTLCGVSIENMASHPNIQGDIGDAYKSAVTDAMKKCMAHFTLGHRAYHGLLPKKK